MRLLYVSHSLPPLDRPLANVGGMQRVASELHDAFLQREGLELSTLVLRASWRWTHLRMVPFAVSLLRRIPVIVRRERIDAVLYSSMVTAALALPLQRRLRRLDVTTAAIPVGRDVTLPFGPYQRLVPRIFRSLDLVFPISRATAAECVERGARPEQIRIVPCGIDPDRFPARRDRESARRELERRAGAAGYTLPAGVRLLFSVGRHVERKGFRWFVEQVMPRLAQDTHFWLAGEGPETPGIRAAVERLGLAPRVRIVGRVDEDELSVLFAGSDLFVMPNVPVVGDIEGFGVVMLEAGLHGLPIVAAGIEGILDVVRDGENGVLLPTGSVDAFVETITRLLADEEARHSLGERATLYTSDRFGWPSIAACYLDHLREHGSAGARTTSTNPRMEVR